MPRRVPPSEMSEAQQATALEQHVLALLKLMQKLATEKPVASGDLEDLLNVSGRTIRRYIATLKNLGYDIRTRRNQGYQLTFRPEQWQGFLPVNVLTELRTLEVLRSSIPLPNTLAKDTLGSLIQSTLDESSGDLKRTAERLQRALAWRGDIPRQNKAAAANLRLCLQAIAHLHPLEMTYTDSKGVETRRVIEPWGCLFTSGTWYCLANDRLRNDRRNFALERMSEVNPLTSQSYVFPERFDIDTAYTGSWGIWRTTTPEIVEFIVEARLSQFFLECEFPFPNKKRKHRDGRVQVRTSSADLAETARWLAPYADQLEIVSPVSLRKEIADRAREALKRHG
ncbi:MAG: WYL domain-containing protein [bacterium]